MKSENQLKKIAAVKELLKILMLWMAVFLDIRYILLSCLYTWQIDCMLSES